MLIFPPVKVHIDSLLFLSLRAAVVALAALGILLPALFWFYPSASGEVSLKERSSASNAVQFAYEAIGSGGLALRPRHALGWVSRLADELSLLAYNSRPDSDAREAKVLVALKNGKEMLALPNGKQLFLKESQQGKGLSSSEAATSLWVKPILLDNGTVLIEACRAVGESEEKEQFIVSPQGGVPAQYNPSQQPFAMELKGARSFSHDLLVQKYGGREYAYLSGKAIVEMARGNATYACFVAAGDYLAYDNGEWKVCPREQLQADRPVAVVKAVSQRGIEIEAWDETGFYPVPVQIGMEQGGRVQSKPEMMPSGIRLRSATQVSCAFGKKRVILRQGDWLLKTSSGWRNLRRADEIDNFLNHRLKGDLLIFDAIEKDQGRLVMKGTLFDESRTQMQPIHLPIEAEKAPGKLTRKRKPLPMHSEKRAAA